MKLKIVEDLFYNISLRRKALRSPSDEFRRVLEVVKRYGLQNPHISFICKRFGGQTADLQLTGLQNQLGGGVSDLERKELLRKKQEAIIRSHFGFDWPSSYFFFF